jgi:hypothetical protein
MLLVTILTVVWLAMMSGSLLMTLSMWAVFDVIWFVVRLISRADGEQVIWATALHGIASLILWVASLLLLRSGDTGLWWLMRPSMSVLTLLYVAALIRTGFYPFQIGHVAAPRASFPLALMSTMGSVMGVALLYRLAVMPGGRDVPGWVVGWGCVSVLWAGVKALNAQGREAVSLACFGALLAAVTGGIVSQQPDLLMVTLGVWVAASSLTIAHRPRRGVAFLLTLPTLFAVGLLLGAPPSPFLNLYTSALSEQTGIMARAVYAGGLILIATSLLHGLRQSPVLSRRASSIHLRASQVGGWLLIVGILVVVLVRAGVAPVMSTPMVDRKSVV